MYEKTYGAKYEETKHLRGGVEIAKLIRVEIKTLVKSGKLPKGKYSVKSSYNSIDLTVSDIKLPRVFSDERLEYDDRKNFRPISERYSPEFSAAIKLLEKIHGAYNYDGSDLQSDYFDVRYYGHVTLGWEWEAKKLEEERALVAALKVEADYVARELAAGNPEIVKLVTEHVARAELDEDEEVLKRSSRAHLTLVKPAPAFAKSEALTVTAHVYLKHIGAD